MLKINLAAALVEVDTATGGYTNLRGWNTTPVIDYAHQRGVKVTLTVTNFGAARNTKILSDTVKRRFLLTTVVQQLKSRNGDGVSFDFETEPATQRANMVDFCRRAVRMIKNELPAAEISLATPATDWSSAWDYASLAVGAGTLLLTSVLPIDNDLLKWITGAAVGGGAAATVQGGSVITRLFSTKLTAGAGNPVVATGENVAAIGTSLLSLVIPFFVVAGILLLMIFIFTRLRKRPARQT